MWSSAKYVLFCTFVICKNLIVGLGLADPDGKQARASLLLKYHDV